MRQIVRIGLCIMAATLALTACEKDSNVRNKSFVVEPGRAKLGPDDSIAVFRAIGGTPPYAWSVSDANLGSVASDSHIVTYTRSSQVGVNTVRVTDGNNWQAEAIVYQHNDEP